MEDSNGTEGFNSLKWDKKAARQKFLSSFFFVLDWFKKSDAFGYKRCSIIGQPRLNFHVWVTEHSKCPKGNRCARGPNTMSTHVASLCFCAVATTGMGSAGSKGKVRRLTEQPGGKHVNQNEDCCWEWGLVYMFPLACLSSQRFLKEGERLSPWKSALSPHFDSNCKKVFIQKLLTWTSHAVLHCSHHGDVSGVLLSFLWCGCPRLGTSHRCFTAKLSTVLHLRLLNSARDLQDDE